MREFGSGPDAENENTTFVCAVLERKGQKLLYEYDFGDSWLHEIELETLTEESARLTTASCLAGDRSAPPEDCGGTPGYYMALEAARDPEHPDHEQWKEWLDGFDPSAFGLAALNRALKRIEL